MCPFPVFVYIYNNLFQSYVSSNTEVESYWQIVANLMATTYLSL